MASRYWSFLIVGLVNVLVCSSLHAQNDFFATTQDDERATQQDPAGLDESDGEELDGIDRGPQQTVKVLEERAGWQAAGIGLTRGRLSEKLRSNWVMVDANGLLRGTVIGFDSAPVFDVTVNLVKNGQVVNTARVNEQGQFSFNNVQQGTYGLVGFGPENFFAFGFDAIRNSDNPRADAPKSITVMAAPNKTTINTDWISYFGPDVKYRVYGRFESREGTEDPEALYGTDGISTHYPEAFPATSIQSHAVTALSDGRLLGRVHQVDSLNGRPVDVRNTRVMLLRNDDVYAATSSDNYGVFAFTQIEPGYYTLVAAGDDGLAAIGLEVVDTAGLDPAAAFDDESEMQSRDEEVVPIDITLLPSESAGWLLSYANEAAYQRILMASARLNAQRNQCNCPPLSAAQREALVRALQPSKRGAFWKRLNNYFDEVVYGDTAQGQGVPAPGQGGYQPIGSYPPAYPAPGGYAPAYPTQGYYQQAPMMQRTIPMNSRPISGMPPAPGVQQLMAPADTFVRPFPSNNPGAGGAVQPIEPIPNPGNDTTSIQGYPNQNQGYPIQNRVPAYQSGYSNR